MALYITFGIPLEMAVAGLEAIVPMVAGNLSRSSFQAPSLLKRVIEVTVFGLEVQLSMLELKRSREALLALR